jgi:hypothetical protein
MAETSMLPGRQLQCTVGRVVNFDPTKQQTVGDLVYEGSHRFVLFLPPTPVRQTPPPDALDKPDPVDPRTRILSDPDNIARQAKPGFVRVVDLWPDRVELAGQVDGDMVNAIVVGPIDLTQENARIFMTHADELTHWDMSHIYQGSCKITVVKNR